MAKPSSASHVEVTVHIRYDAKLKRVMVACTDPDFNTIFYLKHGTKPEQVAREMLIRYGKMSADAP